jgi:flagellar biosynthesis protein FlhA
MSAETAAAVKPSFLSSVAKNSDAFFSLSIVGVLLLMILPLPTPILSFLLVLNISLSVVILLVSMYINNVLEFSSFPSMLLAITIFRLALNIASTKLILLQGNAGEVVRAFGEVVVRGNPVVGFVIFLILVIIQFIVITKGAERISEVAARFTLDAMPGKQMAIDADLNAGIIGEEEARRRRQTIRQEADFYGAMDGASKFVRGDAIASIITVGINSVGGIIIGFLQGSMGWMDILKTYTILTIGDGLAHQIPALFISTATGIIITRTVSSGTNLGQEIGSQLFSYPKALLIASGVLVLFGIFGAFTNMPSLPFLAVAAIIAGIIYASKLVKKEAAAAAAVESEKAKIKKAEALQGPEDVTPLLILDVLELEIGYSLITLADRNQGGDLLDRITMVRKQCTQELGIIVPPVRIRDNIALSLSTYIVKIRGIEIARGEIMGNHFLAINPGIDVPKLKGIETKDPAFGLPAYWITEDQRNGAEMFGYTVIDPSSIIATHLTEVIKTHAAELLGRQDVQQLVNNVKEKGNSTVVDELIPGVMNIGGVQKVLQNLLRERVSIRDLVTILETLADYAPAIKDMDILTEYVRRGLARQISKQYQSPEGNIFAITIDPKLEKIVNDSLQHSDRGSYLSMDPVLAQKLFDSLSDKAEKAAALNYQPLVICPSTIRVYFRRFIEQFLPGMAVVSYSEISPDIKIKPIGMVSIE